MNKTSSTPLTGATNKPLEQRKNGARLKLVSSKPDAAKLFNQKTLAQQTKNGFDAHEQEAEHFAGIWHRACQGSKLTESPQARSKAKTVTQASAASYLLPSSTANPLPSDLRAAMEQFFGADLSAVRIHNDAEAARAARREKANAFAAANHIYFSQGMYQPDTLAGQHLLIHETTHVLQQTGRAASNGLIRATCKNGQGTIQRDKFSDNADKFDIFDTRPTWEALKKYYENDPDYSTNVAVLDKIVEQSESNEVGTLAINFKSIDKLSDSMKAFHIDTLKYLGENEAAYSIVMADKALPTAYSSKSFYEYVQSQGLDWLPGLAETHDLTKQFYPDRFVYGYFRFFLSPDKVSIDLQKGAASMGQTAFLKQLLGQMNDQKEIEGLAENELQLCMMLAFYHLENGRRKRLADKVERGDSDTLVDAIKKYASKFKFGEADKLAPTSLDESKKLFSHVFARLQASAQQAVDFWSQANSVFDAHVNQKVFEKMTAAEVKALADEINTDTRFTNVKASFKSVADDILPLDPSTNAIRSHSYIKSKVKSHKKKLTSQMGGMVQATSELVRKGETNTKDGLLYGLVLTHLASLEDLLSQYSPDNDKALSNKKHNDERKALRLRLAKFLVERAQLFGWNDLQEMANNVFLEDYHLAIVSGWEPDPELKVFGDLSKELTARIKDWTGTGITTALLDRFLVIAYYDAVIAKVDEFLKGDFSDEESIRDQAFRHANENTERPTRHIVREWEYSTPDFEQHISTGAGVYVTFSPLHQDLHELIFANDQTTDYLANKRSDSDIALAPIEYLSQDKALFLWIIPRYEEFIQRVSHIAQVEKAVAAYITAAGITDAPDASVDYKGWMANLVALIKILRNIVEEGETKKETEQNKAKQQQLLKDILAILYPNSKKDEETLRTELIGKISDDVKANVYHEYDEKRLEAVSKLREATSRQLQVRLTEYDRFDRTQWNVPKSIFEQITAFAKFAGSEPDGLLQVATLILEISHELYSAFGPHENYLGTAHLRRHDLLDILLTLSWGALDQWDTQQTAAAEKAKEEATKNPNKPPKPVSDYNKIIEYSWMAPSTVSDRVSRLQKLNKSLHTRVEGIQRTRGIQAKKQVGTGDDATGGSVTSVYWEQRGWSLITAFMDNSTTLAVGQGFSVYQHNYKLHSVNEDFNFYPGFHNRDKVGIEWPDKHRPGDPILEINGNTVTKADASGKVLMTVFHILPSGEQKVEKITDKMPGKLAWFSDAFSEFMAFEYIGGAGNLIETMAEIELEVLELLVTRGAGKAAKVAILVGHIVHFLASNDFDEIREKLFVNPQLVKKGLEDLLANGSASLVEGLLFKKLPFETKFIAPDVEDDGKKKKKSKSRLVKLMSFVADQSEEAVRSFMRLKSKVRGKFVGAQSLLVSKPLVVTLIEALPTLLDILKEFPDQSFDLNDVLGITNPQQAKATLEKQLQNIVDSLLEMELPKELIPTDLAIEILIEYALRAFGAKGKILAEIVQAVRADQVVGKVLADKFENHPLNPNIYWQKDIVGDLENKLGEARNSLYAEVRELVSTATQGQLTLRASKDKSAKLKIDDSKPQLSPLQNPAQDQMEEYPAVHFFGGQKLPSHLLQKFSDEFGHNFEHVRLHNDPHANELTAATGSFALTCGSHVFLNNHVDISSHFGLYVMRHELSHVLQQTGPQPLDQPGSHIPVVGKKGGLTRDPVAESGADKMAQVAAIAKRENEPIEIEGQGRHGMMPSDMGSVARQLLDELVDDKMAKDFSSTVKQKVPNSVAKKATFKHAKGEAETFWKQTRDIINGNGGGGSLVFKPPLNHTDTSKQNISKYLGETFNSNMTSAMSGIVMRSVKTKANGRSFLLYPRIVSNFETFIFAETGFAVEIKKSTKNAPYKVIVKYLHLPYLYGGSDAFKLMKSNTEAAVPTAKKSLFTDKNVWTRIRKILEERRHESKVWHPSKFQFSEGLIDELVGNAAKNIDGILVVSKDVKIQSWEEYADPTNIDSSFAGLRVATHGELTNKASSPAYSSYTNMPDSARKDRQSHHIPQYLLIEYFRGTHKKLFANDNEYLPGFIKSGTGVSDLKGYSVDNNATSLSIDFKDYDPNAGRGDKLPAISLASVTHQKGRLHINAASNWDLDDETKGKGTQSMRIDNLFWKELKANTGVSETSKSKIRSKYNTLNDIDKKSFRQGTYKAMKATYKYMYDFMIGQLDDSLVEHEIPYFKDIAMAMHPNVEEHKDLPTSPTNFNPSESKSIINHLVTKMASKNNDVMGAWKG